MFGTLHYHAKLVWCLWQKLELLLKRDTGLAEVQEQNKTSITHLPVICLYKPHCTSCPPFSCMEHRTLEKRNRSLKSLKNLVSPIAPTWPATTRGAKNKASPPAAPPTRQVSYLGHRRNLNAALRAARPRLLSKRMVGGSREHQKTDRPSLLW